MHYYFLDTETTSAEPTATVVEVAWLKTDGEFNIIEKVQSLIDPEQMISPGASGIHGLVNKDCDAFPTLQEFFTVSDPSCHGALLEAPSAIIGHRIGFDMRFVESYFAAPPQEVCTLRWVRKLYPYSDDHKLSTMIYALDLPRSEGAHRAMADVMSAYYLCRHICERTGMSLSELTEASKQPMEVLTMPFGKNKGQPFSSIPKSYLRWMRENMQDLDIDFKYTLSLFLK